MTMGLTIQPLSTSILTVVVIVTTCLFQLECCHGMTESHFHKTSITNVLQRVSKRCSKQVNTGSRDSPLECVSRCQRDEECKGASVDEWGKCFHHRHCVIVFSSPSEHSNDTHDTFWEKRCVNGQWDSATQSCQCQYLSTGERCERCVSSCEDLTSHPNGEYTVCIDPDPTKSTQILVRCDIIPLENVYRTKFARNSGGVTFHRGWDDYARGFVVDGGHYWMGLDTLHVLTTVTTMKVVDISTSGFIRYFGFVVGGFHDHYSFTFSSTWVYGSSPGSCMEDLKNVPFSTFDKDQDNEPGINCASDIGVGWWYDTCTDGPCVLLDGYDSTEIELHEEE